MIYHGRVYEFGKRLETDGPSPCYPDPGILVDFVHPPAYSRIKYL